MPKRSPAPSALKPILVGLAGGLSLLALTGCVETATAPSGKSAQAAPTPPASSARDKNGNPVHTPGICRKVLVETTTIPEAAETVKRVQTERRVVKYSYGVYRLQNGRYIGAETLNSYHADPRWWENWFQDDGYRGRAQGIARYVDNGWYPRTARCTDGRDIAGDTGVRIEYTKPNTGGGLIGAVITGVASAMANAGNHTSSGSTTPPPAASTPQQAPGNRGVTRDGNGWVKVDGRTIGRTWVSYGYNISCQRGYNPGYGSKSVFGGSFKADVSSMDEAVGVVLAACKR